MSRTFVAVLLAVAGLAGLFMTACGGIFSFAWIANPRDPYARGILIMSLPSLIAGVVVLWLVFRRYKAWRAVGQTIAQIESTRAPGTPPDAP